MISPHVMFDFGRYEAAYFAATGDARFAFVPAFACPRLLVKNGVSLLIALLMPSPFFLTT
jgi:hypothetical protein